MREAAFILLASEVPLDEGQTEWEHDEQLAAEGKWDMLDIDPPPADDLEPVSVEEFIKNA